MTQTHTPAPWVVCGDKKVVSQAKGWAGLEIANCMTYDASIAQRQANARLIAAAPELLEALIEVEQMIHAGELSEGTMSIVREAIAKARGQV